MLMHVWNHLNGTQDQPLRGQSKYSLYVWKCDTGLVKTSSLRMHKLWCNALHLKHNGSFEELCSQSLTEIWCWGNRHHWCKLGCFCTQWQHAQQAVRALYKKKNYINRYIKNMSIIYIVGGIVLSISSTRGLRASRLGTALFLGLWISLFFHGICRRPSSGWGFEVRNVSTLTYSF